MDAIDAFDIEFLDLSEVDEQERVRIKASLKYSDSCVKLPWLKKQHQLKQKESLPAKPQAQDIHLPPENVFMAPPAVTHVVIPQFQPHPGYVFQSNVVCYNSTGIQPQYPPQPIFIQPYYPAAVPQHNGTLHSPPDEPPVVETEEKEVEENVKQTPPAAPKSWASLFNSNKATNGLPQGNNAKSKSENDENKKNEKPQICPIKHPRKSGQFIDPDCYRMGEFLTSYIIDGKAISLQPRGLLNQSNYCYINSILQALMACPPFYNLMNGLSQNISSNEKRKPTPVIDGMCRLVKEFKHLPANLRVSNRRSDGKIQKKDQNVMINTDAPFEPSWVYKMLTSMRHDLVEGRQEDAEEFLGCLLNGLNDEMLDLIKLIKNEEMEETAPPAIPQGSESEADKEWQVMGPKNKGSVTRRTDFGKTPISDIFGGLLKSRIHRTGDHITENIQPFFTLQLNIEKVKTVREALEALTSKYQLEGLTSSKTNEEVEAWQQVMLDELPVILILHLKCFDFKLDGCTKIVKALEFPIDLKIETKLLSSKTQTQKEKQYKLFAVVYHDGKEASKGHYVTDAFHVGYSSWLHYDDASVKTVQEDQVLKPQGTRVPYLLFYRRCDTIRSK